MDKLAIAVDAPTPGSKATIGHGKSELDARGQNHDSKQAYKRRYSSWCSRSPPVTGRRVNSERALSSSSEVVATLGGAVQAVKRASGRDQAVTGGLVAAEPQAALDGFGIAYLSQGQAQPYLDRGELVIMLSEWSPPFSGYHLYYPSRHRHSPCSWKGCDTATEADGEAGHWAAWGRCNGLASKQPA